MSEDLVLKYAKYGNGHLCEMCEEGNKIVSVIIPNFNKGEFIKRTLDSLRSQTYDFWEAIIVDDNSTDNSWEQISLFARSDKRIRAYRNQSNKGPGYCRNFGTNKANGEYVIFLDSDDWLSEKCIENRVDEFVRTEKRIGAFDMMIFPMGTATEKISNSVWGKKLHGDALIHFLRHEICWTVMMPMWKRDSYLAIGGYDESLVRIEDVELHTRALVLGLKYEWSNAVDPDCFYYIGGDRIRSNFVDFYGQIIFGLEQYVKKNRRLIADTQGFTKCYRRRLNAALDESILAGIRIVGDAFQAQHIDVEVQRRFMEKMCKIEGKGGFYAWCYRNRFNKMKGFNYLFRRIYRLFSFSTILNAERS